MSATQHQRLVDAQETLRLFIASHRKWKIEDMYKKLKSTFPTHNVRLWEDVNNPANAKITFDGYEIFKGHNIA